MRGRRRTARIHGARRSADRGRVGGNRRGRRGVAGRARGTPRPGAGRSRLDGAVRSAGAPRRRPRIPDQGSRDGRHGHAPRRGAGARGEPAHRAGRRQRAGARGAGPRCAGRGDGGRRPHRAQPGGRRGSRPAPWRRPHERPRRAPLGSIARHARRPRPGPSALPRPPRNGRRGGDCWSCRSRRTRAPGRRRSRRAAPRCLDRRCDR